MPTHSTDFQSHAIAELLARAKGSIAAGENRFKQAAEYIAAAAAKGATQRQIADGVGKSAGWVNGLLQWQRGGYLSDTPFGPAVAASRERTAFSQTVERVLEEQAAAFSQTEQHKSEPSISEADKKILEEQEKAREQEPTEAERERVRKTLEEHKARMRADFAARLAREEEKRREHVFHMRRQRGLIHSSSREMLVKYLGMLGSEHAGERANAALKVEELRRKIGLSWPELIVSAEETVWSKATAPKTSSVH
jgi:hypothetical protein